MTTSNRTRAGGGGGETEEEEDEEEGQSSSISSRAEEKLSLGDGEGGGGGLGEWCGGWCWVEEEGGRVKNMGRSSSNSEAGVRQESSAVSPDSGDERMLKEEGGGVGCR